MLFITTIFNSIQIPIAASTETTPWLMYKHDSQRTGFSTSASPSTNQSLWKSQINGYPTVSSPVIDNGTVYISTRHNMYAFDEGTGELKWETTVINAFSSFAIYQGRLYVPSSSMNTIQILDAYNGSLIDIWTALIEGNGVSCVSSFAIDNGILYYTTTSNSLVPNCYVWAVEVPPKYQWFGAKWKQRMDEIDYEAESSPAINNGKLFVGSGYSLYQENRTKGHLYAFDAETGERLWKFNATGNVISTPTVTSGYVFFGTLDGYVYAVSENGKEIWKQDLGEEICSSPTIAYSRIFILSHAGYLHCLDKGTGKELWNKDLGISESFEMTYEVEEPSPAAASNRIFIGSADGKVMGFSGNTGNILWTYQTDSDEYFFSPAIADDRLFIGSRKKGKAFGYLYAFGPAPLNQKPVAKLSASPTTVIEGSGLVRFDATGSNTSNGRVVSYFYAFGDGTNKNWTTESVTLKRYLKVGQYEAKVKVRNNQFIESDWSPIIIINVISAPANTKIELTIVDGERWDTSMNVPFNITGAENYVQDSIQNGKPSEQDFGNTFLKIQLRNISNKQAENVTVVATISGFVVLVKIDEKDNDLLFPFYSFEPYTKIVTKGTLDTMGNMSVLLGIPVKYMSVIVGKIGYRNKDNYDLSLKILITIVELHIKVKVYGNNFQPVEVPTKMFCLGDPEKLLEKCNDELRERLKKHQQKALEDLLKKEIAASTLTTDTKIYTDVGIGEHRYNTVVKIPETNTLTISTILPQGVTLVGLSVTIGRIIVSIPTTTVNSFGMIIFDDLEKILPKGVVTAQITITTRAQTAAIGLATIGLAQSQQQNGVTLMISKKSKPETYEVYWNGQYYSIMVASNSTVSDFQIPGQGAIINFNSTGVANENYAYKIAIPTSLFSNELKVMINKNQIDKFETAQNQSYTFLSFTCNFSKENNVITIIPEFPSLMFLLFLAVSLLFAIRTKKQRRR